VTLWYYRHLYRAKTIILCVNTFQEFINPFNPTRVNLHEKYNDSRKFKLTSLIILFSALAIQACGGSSSDRFEQVSPVPVPPLETATDGNGNGSDGAEAFRLLANNNNFDLNEGEGITLPVTLQRINGHQRDITLSVREDQAGADSLLQVSLTENQLTGDDSDTTLTANFGLDTQRASEQQRTIIVSASDGINTSEMTMLLNIRPSSLPDVYLLVGQSNMEGFSEDFAKQALPGEPDEPIPAIMQLNVTANDAFSFPSPGDFGNPDSQVGFPDFVVAEDPLHTSRDPSLPNKLGTRIGLGLSFAKQALQTDPNHRIILVPAAWSATGFCNTGDFLAQATDAPDFVAEGELGWNPFEQDDPVFGGTLLFNRAIVRANMTIQRSGGILRGILWHQGESDGDNAICSQAYAGNLATLASELRTRIISDARGTSARGATSDVPFIVGTMSMGNDERGNFAPFSTIKSLVDNVHRSAGEQGLIPNYGVANLDDLVPSNGFLCGEGSCVHYGSQAYREMGVRYHRELQNVLNAQ